MNDNKLDILEKFYFILFLIVKAYFIMLISEGLLFLYKIDLSISYLHYLVGVFLINILIFPFQDNNIKDFEEECFISISLDFIKRVFFLFLITLISFILLKI